MALHNSVKTEHGGHKGSGRKTGFFGLRVVAKSISKKLRRGLDKKLETEAKRDSAD